MPRTLGHKWSRRWLGEQWQEWQPRTRASATQALARFITIAVEHGAKTPEGLRVDLCSALSPESEGGRDAQLEKWMAKNCLPLGELDRESVADIDRRLGLKLDGSPLAANTANRIRIIARASVQSAIDAGAVAANAWPQRSWTQARRKVARSRRSVDVSALPGPAAMAAAIDAIVTSVLLARGRAEIAFRLVGQHPHSIQEALLLTQRKPVEQLGLVALDLLLHRVVQRAAGNGER